jgi:pimeloyl-ACP methyl ester carboxylesterase
MMALARSDGSVGIASAQITGMVGKTTRAERPKVVERVKHMMEQASVDAIVGALTALRDRPDATPTLRTVTVPTLVVVGDEDALTPVSEANAIMAALPDETEKQLEIIAGSGHASCVERPAAVTHALSDFLASLGPLE